MGNPSEWGHPVRMGNQDGRPSEWGIHTTNDSTTNMNQETSEPTNPLGIDFGGFKEAIQKIQGMIKDAIKWMVTQFKEFFKSMLSSFGFNPNQRVPANPPLSSG